MTSTFTKGLVLFYVHHPRGTHLILFKCNLCSSLYPSRVWKFETKKSKQGTNFSDFRQRNGPHTHLIDLLQANLIFPFWLISLFIDTYTHTRFAKKNKIITPIWDGLPCKSSQLIRHHWGKPQFWPHDSTFHNFNNQNIIKHVITPNWNPHQLQWQIFFMIKNLIINQNVTHQLQW